MMMMVYSLMVAAAGNAGFETASHIVGSTAFIHMASRLGN